MEVKPITSLDALLAWKVPEELKEFLISLPPIAPQSLPVSIEKSKVGSSLQNFRTLVCHDMNGGYLDDRFCYGNQKMDAYRFYHWPAIDTFVYFSHHFITIPPCCWVHSAHIHGVQVLGTIITEWKGGESIWNVILANDDVIDLAISKLVEIAYTYAFDGWLINVENKIKPEKICRLVYFVSELTKRMHQCKPHTQVIWYDAVTKEGKLKWQNELNDNNECFFDVCDGIFLNYTWKEENLARSVAAAGQRRTDVYVGVDVFGRNFFAGGGFNCHKALKIIRKHNLSVAIFAQGWTYESFSCESFFANDNKLWKTLERFLLYHGPTQLPFRTSFCQGFGKNFFSQGKITEEGNWHNLSKQQTQPIWEEISRATSSLFSLNTDQAFNGGSCLVMWVDKPILIKMMVCKIPIEFTLEFTFAYRLAGTVKTLSFVFELDYEIKPDSYSSNSADQPPKVIFVAEVEKGKKTSHEEILPESNEKVNGWIVKRYLLPSTKGWISSFILKAEGPGLIKFGELSIEQRRETS